MTKSEAKEEIRLAERQIKQAEYCLKMAEQRKENAEIELEKLKRVDYSNWIGYKSPNGIFCILSEGMLQYFPKYNSIQYDNYNREEYNDKFSYIDIPASDLKYGDCVCLSPEKKEDELELLDFGIFIGYENDGDAIFQTLYYTNNLEKIDYDYFGKKDIVRKFIK